MISLEKLFLTFRKGEPLETPALRGISLTIEQGDFITVIGSNGAGKTSLLNCLTGEVYPDEGRIFFDGFDITRQPAEKRSAHIARVFQDPLLGSCESLSIEENMALAFTRGTRRSLKRALQPDIRHHFRERLSLLSMGLENRLTDPAGLLSGGQRQALALIMATLRPAKLLLLDEHTAALDPVMSERIMLLTQKIIAQWSLTTLMVTHSMSQALAYGRRTIMLHEGEIAIDLAGKEREEMNPEKLVSRFGEIKQDLLDHDSLLL